MPTDPNPLAVQVLTEHRRRGSGSRCNAEGCGWTPPVGENLVEAFARHQVEQLAAAGVLESAEALARRVEVEREYRGNLSDRLVAASLAALEGKHGPVTVTEGPPSWLADHDEQVRRAERERVARVIEAAAQRAERAGIQWDKRAGLHAAAGIARKDPTDG